jgi:hypothetical protein
MDGELQLLEKLADWMLNPFFMPALGAVKGAKGMSNRSALRGCIFEEKTCSLVREGLE